MDICISIEKNEHLPFVTAWIDRGYKLSKISLTKKGKYHMISLQYRVYRAK